MNEVSMIGRLLLVGLLLIAHSAMAEVREIELKDGSVITGTVRSFDGNTYVIDTNSLGTVSVNNTQIRTIRSAADANSRQSMSPSDLMNMQQQLLNDAEVMELIKALQHDPQIQAILNDPQLLKAIAAGDVQALMNNAQFKALMDNPKIQEISNKVQP